MHRIAVFVLLLLLFSFLPRTFGQAADSLAAEQAPQSTVISKDSLETIPVPLSATIPADSVTAKPDSLSSIVVADSVTAKPDSLSSIVAADSLAADSLAADSLAADSLVAEPAPQPVAILPDSVVFVTRPLSLVRSGIADSSLYKGSDYGSFGDVFDWMPGAYYYDRGSIGQTAYGSLFSGSEGQFDLFYDGLYLNDPFTGQADMNVIPVESVGRMQIITSGVDRVYGYSPAGQTMQVTPNDIAGLPIRSTVSYRTGHNGFDDIDARLGIRNSEKMSINMGGIIKGYGGTQYHSNYDANKLNLKIDRRLGNMWKVKYLYLRNLAEIDVPLPQTLPLQEVSIPHETDRRSDHGLQIYWGKTFFTSLQQTFYQQEFYGSYRHTGIDNEHKYQGTRVTSQWQKQFGPLAVQSGAAWQINHLQSNNWGNHAQRSAGAWLNTALKHKDKYYFSAGVTAQHNNGYGMFWQPQASMEYRLCKDLTLFSWLTQGRIIPSFASLYSTGPYASGNAELAQAQYTQAGFGIDSRIMGIDLYAAASLYNIRDQALIYAADSLAVYTNQVKHTRIAVDFALTCPFGKYLSISGKGKYTAVQADDPYFDLTNLPAISAQGYVQYRRIFFRRDLDTRLRIGAMALGESFAPEYYFAQYPLGAELFGPSVSPFVQVTLVVRTMTIFIAMQNIPALEVERVYGWNLPKSQLRWGFTWNFVD